jgi:hypothetical protein
MNYKITLLTLILLSMLYGTTMAQKVNQITIYPTNPKNNDTIYIISDLSYHGNCTYGLLNTNIIIKDSVIHITPFYCGYLDSTLCSSIDTFKIAPLTKGKFSVKIEYHQGSICPVSNFDEIIAKFDTMLSVADLTNLADYKNPGTKISVYPNPTNDHLIIDFEDSPYTADYQVQIINSTGQKVYQNSINHNQFLVTLTNRFESGIYFVYITELNKKTIEKKIIVLK